MSISAAAAFIAGVASVLSPCVLPVAPAIMAGSVGSRLRPLAIVAGMSLTFTLMGGVFTAAGISTGLSGDVLRYLFIGTILLFGGVMLSSELKARFSALGSRATAGFRFGGGRGVIGGFVLGASLGIVWIPCVGPILGSVLALAALQETVLRGTLLLGLYSLGTSLPLLGLAYGGKAAAARLDGLKTRGRSLERAAGLILIGTGIAMALGLDKAVQVALLPYFPELAI